jgi:hypothetical protein
MRISCMEDLGRKVRMSDVVGEADVPSASLRVLCDAALRIRRYGRLKICATIQPQPHGKQKQIAFRSSLRDSRPAVRRLRPFRGCEGPAPFHRKQRGTTETEPTMLLTEHYGLELLSSTELLVRRRDVCTQPSTFKTRGETWHNKPMTSCIFSGGARIRN